MERSPSCHQKRKFAMSYISKMEACSVGTLRGKKKRKKTDDKPSKVKICACGTVANFYAQKLRSSGFPLTRLSLRAMSRKK
jgi:hypothetical protein